MALLATDNREIVGSYSLEALKHRSLRCRHCGGNLLLESERIREAGKQGWKYLELRCLLCSRAVAARVDGERLYLLEGPGLTLAWKDNEREARPRR